ncbi:MAG: TetR family transcriptional regulator [Alphaproteobacteria bacterium]|nr:TetR family transcriptional regulator [Alphaproteobacteria bacterium]
MAISKTRALAGVFADEARHLGKSARTRARLMDAAVGVFARDGFEAASVNEIARAADVANGTFYLHFKDKDAIATEVALRIAGDVARRLDAAMVDLDDAIERTSRATRQFLEIACGQPEWGWALLRAMWSLPSLRKQMASYLRADLKRGVRQGAFTVKVDDLLIEVFTAMAASALLARLNGEAGAEAGSKVAELQLRMLGVPAKRAAATAWRPLAPEALPG